MDYPSVEQIVAVNAAIFRHPNAMRQCRHLVAGYWSIINPNGVLLPIVYDAHADAFLACDVEAVQACLDVIDANPTRAAVVQARLASLLSRTG